MNTDTSEAKSDKQEPYKLNAYQKAAASVYGGGDFVDLAEMEFKNFAEFRESLKDVGDTLFTFVMIELGLKEDCDSVEVARNRISSAVDDLNDVLEALSKIEDEPETRPGP